MRAKWKKKRQRKQARKRRKRREKYTFLTEPMKLMHTSIKVTASLTAYNLALDALTKMRS